MSIEHQLKIVFESIKEQTNVNKKLMNYLEEIKKQQKLINPATINLLNTFEVYILNEINELHNKMDTLTLQVKKLDNEIRSRGSGTYRCS